MGTPGSPERLRFGDFELDMAAYELRRKGRTVKLGRQPMDLLILLIERRPHLVSRADIVDRLWGKDVFVDVETGVNTAISKVRQALRDSAETPAFVERIAGRGYRFVAAVEAIASPSESRVAAGRSDLAPVLEVAPGVTKAMPDHGQVADAIAARSTVVNGLDTIRPARVRTVNRALLAIGFAVIVMAIGALGWRWLGGGRVTLAVLPFQNIGGAAERDALALGLTDETSASLSQIDPQHLTVKGRTLNYVAGAKTAVEIGRELAVDYLVDATVRADASTVRVTATLIRVRDQEHVWSKVYDRKPAGLLALEQELSTDIAQQIRLRVSPDRISALQRRQTQSGDALDAYFKARSFGKLRNPENTAKAITEYQRALAFDPSYALAWTGLASTYAASTVNSDADPGVFGPLAQKAVAEAIRINPNLAEAQKLDGTVKWLIGWKWTAAEASFRRAIDLDPSDSTAFRSLGHALSQSGRHGDAEKAMRRARDLDPLEPMGYALSSQVAFQAGDLPAAIDFAKHAILIGPDLWVGYMQLGQAYLQKEDTAVALEALTDAAKRSHNNSKAISLKGYVLAKMGRINQARDVLRTLEDTSREHYVPPYAMALVYAGLDDRDKVFRWLDKAFDARDVHLIYLPVDPKWDSYRTDPRFVALLAKYGFPASR
jgi:DNA-binding winged helix-turn-helix (wHTH) protein/TolB-like protein/Tfp pilus assembly protein PilF